MITRTITTVFKKLVKQYPIVTITGPRQSGKTTLCKMTFPNMPYFNLENPDDRQFALDDPRGFLAQMPNGGIIDEIQRSPDLPSYIQAISDESNKTGQFILTGSQQFNVINNVSQSLAGRTALLKLLPLTLSELTQIKPQHNYAELLYSGFYPRIFDRQLNPTQALGDYFETYVERDLRQLSKIHNLQLFERFVRLCAGRVGQLLNLNNLASDTGITHSTAREWLTLLEASYIIFLLPPWFTNTKKRLIKSPKLYFYDVGLAVFLLKIHSSEQVLRDPLYGSLFENMIVIEYLKHRYNNSLANNLNFYRDSANIEIDLLLEQGSQFYAIEIKAGSTINSDYFKNLRKLKSYFPEKFLGGEVIYAGNKTQKRRDFDITAFTQLSQSLNTFYND
jgi:predicted AAA+ superfamily ATPase